jgi:integrase
LKHGKQWRSTLTTYVSPVIGDLPVADVEQAHVLAILEPIWASKTETATRIRQRIEAVLDWATARKIRTTSNPARWRGHLDQLLPKPSKIRAVKNHKALPYSQMYEFMSELNEQKSTAARCLEFTILTAARTSEAREAIWKEFDLTAGVWTIPASRIKSEREHRVPLSAAALKIVKGQKGADKTFVFPGAREGRPLSNMAMLELLRRSGKKFTVHGFRSSFRSWAAECTNIPREVAETALAHRVGDSTEQAYQRGDLLAKRDQLMSAWSNYCNTEPATGTVTSITGHST